MIYLHNLRTAYVELRNLNKKHLEWKVITSNVKIKGEWKWLEVILKKYCIDIW